MWNYKIAKAVVRQKKRPYTAAVAAAVLLSFSVAAGAYMMNNSGFGTQNPDNTSVSETEMPAVLSAEQEMNEYYKSRDEDISELATGMVF